MWRRAGNRRKGKDKVHIHVKKVESGKKSFKEYWRILKSTEEYWRVWMKTIEASRRWTYFHFVQDCLNFSDWQTSPPPQAPLACSLTSQVPSLSWSTLSPPLTRSSSTLLWRIFILPLPATQKKQHLWFEAPHHWRREQVPDFVVIPPLSSMIYSWKRGKTTPVDWRFDNNCLSLFWVKDPTHRDYS